MPSDIFDEVASDAAQGQAEDIWQQVARESKAEPQPQEQQYSAPIGPEDVGSDAQQALDFHRYIANASPGGVLSRAMAMSPRQKILAQGINPLQGREDSIGLNINPAEGPVKYKLENGEFVPEDASVAFVHDLSEKLSAHPYGPLSIPYTPFGHAGGRVKEFVRQATDKAAEMATPENALIAAALPFAGKPLQLAASGYFGTQMAKSTVKDIEEGNYGGAAIDALGALAATAHIGGEAIDARPETGGARPEERVPKLTPVEAKSAEVLGIQPVQPIPAPVEPTPVAPEPQPAVEAKPKILSTAIVTPEGDVVRGQNWNDPHFQGDTSILRQTIQTTGDVPDGKSGFVIQEPDGTERVTTDRKEAAKIAADAGQVEGNPKELHSQDLIEPPKPTEQAAPESQPEPVATPPEQVPVPETSDQGPTGIRNAKADQDRVRLGLPPAMQPARQAFGAAWDSALKTLDQDPAAALTLQQELAEKPRAATPEETALLTHRKIDLETQHAKAAEELQRAYDSKDPSTIDEASLKHAQALDSLQKLFDVTKSVGTKSGQSLSARRLMVNRDYTLANMLIEKRTARGGKPLTPEEQAGVKQHFDKIKETQAAADEAAATAQQRQSEGAFQEEHKKLLKQAKRTRKSKEEVVSGPISSFLEKHIAAAEKRIAERRGKLFASPLHAGLNIADHAIIGAGWLAKGVLKFSDWSKEMLNQFGEEIRPRLASVYAQSKEVLKAHQDIAAGAARLEAAKNEGATLREAAPVVREIALGAVKAGQGKEWSQLRDAVHDVVSTVYKDTSPSDTMNAISGYGETTQLSKDAAKTELRARKGEMQQIGKLESMAAGEAPLRTGQERRTPSDVERGLIKQVNEAKKKGGFTVTDPEAQLRSSLQSRETALKNQIRDISNEIERGQRAEKPGAPPTNDRIEALKALRDRLRQTHDEIFGRKGLTDEQRVQNAIKAQEILISQYKQMIKDRRYSRDSKARLTSPELESLRARTGALRAELDEMKQADQDLQEFRKEQALEKRIREADERLKSGEVSGQPKAADVPTESRAKLQEELAAKTKELAERRKAANALSTEERIERQEATKQKALQKQIDDLNKRIASGDIEARSTRNLGPETEPTSKLQQERDALAKQLADMRNASKALTPEEIATKREAAALKAHKSRTANRIAELESRVARSDFSKAPKRTITLDIEGMRLQAAAEKAKLDYERALEKDRLANRTRTEKFIDAIPKWNTARVLASPLIIGKLAATAAHSLVLAPIERGIAHGVGKLLPSVAERSPKFRAGFDLNTEVKATTEALKRYWDDIKTYTKTGHIDIDLVHGKKDTAPIEFSNFFGRIHGAMKTVVRRREFIASLEYRLKDAAMRGEDITEPDVQTKYGLDAYKDANASIFAENNRFVEAYKRALSRFSQVDKATGKVSVGNRLVGAAIRTAMPVVNIPTNLALRSLEYAFGTIQGGARLAMHLKDLEKLPPEHADLIIRNFARGSIGAGFLLWGFFDPNAFGGYYRRDKKQENQHAAPGQFHTPIGNTPAVLIHHPLYATAQIGATVRRIYDSQGGKLSNIPLATVAGFFGMLQDVPFAGLVKTVNQALTEPEKAQFTTGLGKAVVPSPVRVAAQMMDEKPGTTLTHRIFSPSESAVQRKPKGFVQGAKVSIPVLRKTVPRR